MNKYTPNTEQVRRYWLYGVNAWKAGRASDFDAPDAVSGDTAGAQFDRWLQAHEVLVRVEASASRNEDAAEDMSHGEVKGDDLAPYESNELTEEHIGREVRVRIQRSESGIGPTLRVAQGVLTYLSKQGTTVAFGLSTFPNLVTYSTYDTVLVTDLEQKRYAENESAAKRYFVQRGDF